MTVYRDTFLFNTVDLFLAYVGTESYLIFNQDVDLPSFASYPLWKTTEGRELLKGYLKDLLALGKETHSGVILESPT
jgi:homocysteine S-methyltransferase